MRRKAAFTLIEVLAVVFLTAVVMTLALDYYLDLSRASKRAADHTRDVRRVTATLDRLAHDFERTILLRKPPEVDPLTHPWIFLGESQASDLGADRLKFVTRNHVSRSGEAHESDLAVVSYQTRRDEEGRLELRRSTETQLPESLDRDLPYYEDDGVLLVADGLYDFGVRFLPEAGEWTDSWDSSQILESGELPLAVEISIAVPASEDSLGEEEAVSYSRIVMLPVRPIDPASFVFDPNAAVGGGSGDPTGTGPDGELTRDDIARIFSELTGEAPPGASDSPGGGSPPFGQRLDDCQLNSRNEAC